MAKKNNKHSTADSELTHNPPVQIGTAVDLLEVRLSKHISSKRSDTSPKAVLSDQDAATLDVRTGEPLIVLALDESRANSLSGAVIAKTEISTISIRSPRNRSDGRRNHISPGKIQISPTSTIHLLLPDEPSDVSSPASPGPQAQYAIPATALPVTPNNNASFPDKSGGYATYETPRVNTPSTPDTGFSFKSTASTSSKALTPRQPITPSGTTSCPIWIIPLESVFGAQLAKNLCRRASAVNLKVMDESRALDETEDIVKQLVLTYCAGQYVQLFQNLRISFQGRPLDLKVVSVDGSSNVSASFAEINLDGGTGSFGANEDSLLFATQSTFRKLYYLSSETSIRVSAVRSIVSNKRAATREPKQRVVGLSLIMERIRQVLLTPMLRPELFAKGSMKRPRGILLHGPSGVGKSSLARQLGEELESILHVQYVNCSSLQSQTSIVGEAERELSRLFRLSGTAKKQNRLLIFDDIHLICPRRGGYAPGTDQLASTLLSLIDGVDGSEDQEISNEGLVLLAITTNASLLDPALRRPGRIDVEVEVPIPDEASTRAEILQFHLGQAGASPPAISSTDWISLAKLAKGFNGADCMLAMKEAIRSAILRNLKATVSREISSPPPNPTFSDLSTAIRATKPSIIKSVTVEIPKVLWSSIGGMESVKRELREAIEIPLTHSDLFIKLGIPPPRGILLYGPPGCSKTLMARALATEGHMNFLAVKGPELLSKWLGESERALASLFKRARMASPSIVFFDEIDAIASKRGAGDSSSSGRLLSQLLTELDGVTNTVGNTKQRVVVVGATNRPDILDSALTRPGRIDRMIYVGVPDSDTRVRIFQITLAEKSCSQDVDIEHLARDDVTQGFSGAECVAICRDAALLALEEIEDTGEDIIPQIRMQHLLEAAGGMKRQITPQMIEFYASFREKGFAKVQVEIQT
jgi:SpoVK/Ycf46/Vps4 family AAA+-type ATPase